ncbi:tRNA pseudouridine(55) synthase TruB, partial [Candidatus Gracilibacteria bacterium]|nr:tRNA pseudouridine(55) synthase TruB [Candidatus Gracilibacteria bacterium]
MDAFFYIDKPSGCTSFDVLRDMRRKLGIKKFGHTGTLDPLATGGLLVASGNYTKLLSYLHADRKTYTADIMLDGTSPSLDRDTEIDFISEELQKQARNNISLQDIQKLLKESFHGEIEQVPPSYSALKINGKKALDRVLAGEEVQLEKRRATIYSCDTIEYSYPLLRLHLRVSAGTYIRSIARDLGELLGLGAYISELRRTKVGDLDISLATLLDEVTPQTTLSPELLFGDYCKLMNDEEIY